MLVGRRNAGCQMLWDAHGALGGELTQAWVRIAMIIEVDGRCHGSTMQPGDISFNQLQAVGYRVANSLYFSWVSVLSQLLPEDISDFYLPHFRPPYAGLCRPIHIPMPQHVSACKMP